MQLFIHVYQLKLIPPTGKDMKKIFLLFVMLICGISINAQVTVSEPEFADETLLLTSNGQGVLLKRENGTVKTKAGASLYLVGIGKVKSRLTLAGVHSASTIKGAATTRLIIRAKDNTTDPNSFISIFKFDVTKKERRYQLAESGTLSKTETNNLSSVEFKAKKYGKSSYLLLLEDLQPGEYGIVIGDPNNTNEKNSMKVTTFTVE